ncbi:hypothetical protein V8E54_011950, partial [Elaphomyces granulatus]
DLKHGPDELELPPYVETPIPFLPIHRGLVCQVDPDTCRHVGLTVSSMRSHIKVAHRPAQQSNTATRLRRRQQTIGADTRQWRDAFCQRFFTNGAKSSHFEVRHVGRGTAGRPPTPEPTMPDRPAKRARTDAGPDPFRQLMAHAAAGYETTLRDSRAAVGGRGNDEPNPLLQWTGWDKYLRGYEWVGLEAWMAHPMTPSDLM